MLESESCLLYCEISFVVLAIIFNFLVNVIINEILKSTQNEKAEIYYNWRVLLVPRSYFSLNKINPAGHLSLRNGIILCGRLKVIPRNQSANSLPKSILFFIKIMIRLSLFYFKQNVRSSVEFNAITVYI